MSTPLMLVFVELDAILSCYDIIAWSKAKMTKYVKERHHCSVVKSGTWLWLACNIMQLRYDNHDAIAGRKPSYTFHKPASPKYAQAIKKLNQQKVTF